MNTISNINEKPLCHCVTSPLNKGSKTRPMKDSGIAWIGEIPEDWEIKRFKNLGFCRNGLTYSPEDLCDSPEGILVLRSSNIQNGKLTFDDCVYVKTEIKPDLMVQENDILICSRNGSAKLIGKNAIIPTNLKATFGAFMIIYRCSSPLYLKYILNSNVFTYNLATFLTATVNQLTNSNFLNIQIPYTSNKAEQTRISDFLDKKCAAIDSVL